MTRRGFGIRPTGRVQVSQIAGLGALPQFLVMFMDDVSLRMIEVVAAYRRFLRSVVAQKDVIKAQQCFQDLKKMMDRACESELKSS